MLAQKLLWPAPNNSSLHGSALHPCRITSAVILVCLYLRLRKKYLSFFLPTVSILLALLFLLVMILDDESESATRRFVVCA